MSRTGEIMMQYVHRLAAAAALVAIAALAVAGPLIQPVPVGTETIRFFQGVPTLDLQRGHGAVQITPLPMDHGSYAFTVAVLNKGPGSANMDVSNIDVESGGAHYTVFSRSDLEHKAKHRAFMNSLALAAIGGVAAAAAAAASARDTYRATTYTPHGTYRTVITTPSAAGQAASAAAIAGTGVGIYAIQNQLDKTREALGATTVQMTTVDPQDSYAGRIVLAKIKETALPQRVNIVVRWNGETYPFGFQLAKKGTPQPVFDTLTPVPPAPSMAPTSNPNPTASPPAVAMPKSAAGA